MEKIINVLLVVVLVLILGNMYLPKKKFGRKKSHRRTTVKREENDEKPFSMNNVSFKNLMTLGKGRETELLPVGTLEVITKDETAYVPVTFNKRGVFMIGSAPDCDLVLHSPYIGAHHCSIEYDEENDEIVLFDDSSKNGIYDASRNRVDEIVMEKGKEFYIAKCVHLKWNDFNAFMQVDEKDLPTVVHAEVKESTGTKPIPKGMAINV